MNKYNASTSRFTSKCNSAFETQLGSALHSMYDVLQVRGMTLSVHTSALLHPPPHPTFHRWKYVLQRLKRCKEFPLRYYCQDIFK